ncbi:glycosyltransferase [Euhalothece natronophila Z-M001]|uniref:4,4'-diaponeurosporenoate glycosyltransferase n=1 Tax=Euhalothece natronophila Z-M001 TaxID=522448 RepID=A0A5B8NM35_9CHRO|nr:TIGR04283 family arsenosugar biosynthesis glycosyltransferase [Euhalothece natronophila]QDZ40352.1 glycosyltransferase [Euhalothece natronophila Z-M001]
MADVSIIIPTFNEARYIKSTLNSLQVLTPPAKEIIIVDGESQDKTLFLIQNFIDQTSLSSVIKCISTSPSRSQQMNKGAEIATGDYLCFLHADTYVPPDLITIIGKTLLNPSIAGGGFISIMCGDSSTRWGISLHNFLKTYYTPLLFRPHLFFTKRLRILFGDQVIFCRRQNFLDCGGFDTNLPIMEEADFCLRLCQYGHIKQVNRIVESSDRRVAKWGAAKANLIYLMIGFLWGMGVSAQWLKQFYDEIR